MDEPFRFSDLEDYWETYRGYKINYQPACYLMSQIRNDIRNAIRGMDNGEFYYKNVIRAAHAETVMPVLAMWNAVPTSKLR